MSEPTFTRRKTTFAVSKVTTWWGGKPERELTAKEIIMETKHEAEEKSEEFKQADYWIGDDPVEDILRKFGYEANDWSGGLSDDQVQKNRDLYGRNEMEAEEEIPLWRRFLAQFEDATVLMLVAAAIISAALGEPVEAIVILAIVIANAVVAVRQETSASEELAAMEAMTKAKTKVFRNGEMVSRLDTTDLVAGDLVILANGDIIGADMRLIEVDNLSVEEKSLTGESVPITKEVKFDPNDEEVKKSITAINCVYAGCSVAAGGGKAIVCNVGTQMRIGKMNSTNIKNKADKGPSPLQEKLENLGHKLALVALFVVIVIFVVGLTTERGVDPDSDTEVWLQVLLMSVGLAVAAVPEGLPAIVTITLAMGMKGMLEKNALIKKLQSVETLGSASVICSDKTGTLTKGEMSMVRVMTAFQNYRVTGGGYDPTSGGVIPIDVNHEDEKSVTQAVQNSRKGGAFTVPLFVGVLCTSEDSIIRKKVNGSGQVIWEGLGNFSERPIVCAARKVGREQVAMKEICNIDAINPFDSKRKMMSVLANMSRVEEIKGDEAGLFQNTKQVACVKGATTYVLKKCQNILDLDENGLMRPRPITEDDKKRVLACADQYADQTFRVLATAYQPFESECKDTSEAALEDNLTLCGLMAYEDPARQECKVSIAKARRAGIRTVMITGDNIRTAVAIAKQINLLLPSASADKEATTCGETIRKFAQQMAPFLPIVEDEDGQYSEAEKADAQRELDAIYESVDALTARVSVYARASPKDKIVIVRSLQRQGHVCSMTGDGVNDSMALTAADIGVAMGLTGTPVAQAAAEMILRDDNFSTIVDAVEQGRVIYANIHRFVAFLLSTNCAEILIIFICICLGLQSPLQAIQLLWMNLVTDGAPALALAMEKGDDAIMLDMPRPKTEDIVDKTMILSVFVNAWVLTASVLTSYIVGLEWATGTWNGDDADIHDIAQAQTMAFLTISFAELFRAYSVRHERRSVFSIGIFGNKYMQYAIGFSGGLMLIVSQVPGIMGVFHCEYLDGKMWALVISMSIIPALGDETLKFFVRRSGWGLRESRLSPDLNTTATNEVVLNQLANENPETKVGDVTLHVDE